MDSNGIGIEQWREMTHAQRCEAFLRMTPERAEMVTRNLLENLGSPRELAELFVAASHWGDVPNSPCNVDRVIALANYLREDGGDDAVLEPVRIAAWHADGRLPSIGRSPPARRVELACEILSAYAMVDVASTPPAMAMPSANHTPQHDTASGDTPDLIAWPSGPGCRVFPTSESGLTALMAHASFARYGVPLIAYGGVDASDECVEQMQRAGLTVGRCSGDEMPTTIAAVCAWRDGGCRSWSRPPF